jgi:hypothetical protein
MRNITDKDKDYALRLLAANGAMARKPDAEILYILIADGCAERVTGQDALFRPYMITDKGRAFLACGGYVGESQRRQTESLQREQAERRMEKNHYKRDFIMVLVGVVVTKALEVVLPYVYKLIINIFNR